MWFFLYCLGVFITGFLVRFYIIWYDKSIHSSDASLLAFAWPGALPIFLVVKLIVLGMKGQDKLIKWLKKRAENKIKLKNKPEFVVYNPEITEGSFRDAPKCTACGRIYLDKAS